MLGVVFSCTLGPSQMFTEISLLSGNRGTPVQKQTMEVTPLTYLASRGQKRALVPLKLGLPVFISHHVVLGIKLRSSGKTASVLND